MKPFLQLILVTFCSSAVFGQGSQTCTLIPTDLGVGSQFSSKPLPDVTDLQGAWNRWQTVNEDSHPGFVLKRFPGQKTVERQPNGDHLVIGESNYLQGEYKLLSYGVKTTGTSDGGFCGIREFNFDGGNNRVIDFGLSTQLVPGSGGAPPVLEARAFGCKGAANTPPEFANQFCNVLIPVAYKIVLQLAHCFMIENSTESKACKIAFRKDLRTNPLYQARRR